MKIESQVLSLSWIPSEAVKGVAKLGFEMGPLHYDEPRPTRSPTRRISKR